MSLGRSMIDDRKRITLVNQVSELLGVKPGDYVCFEEDDAGNVYLKGYGLRKKPINNRERDGNERNSSHS